MESVKRKNVALRALIEAVEIPQPELLTGKSHLHEKSIEDNLDLFMHDAIELEETEGELFETLDSKNYKMKPVCQRKESKKLASPNAKKLPQFWFPSSQNSPKIPNMDVPKRSSGLVPDLMQPDIMALKI
jgi:hypothetical protein